MGTSVPCAAGCAMCACMQPLRNPDLDQCEMFNINDRFNLCREPEEIFIIGTSHVSQQSADDVGVAIDAIKPDAVVVELCKGRSARLFQDQLEGDSAAKAAGPMSMTGLIHCHW